MARTINLLSDDNALKRSTSAGNIIALSSLSYDWTSSGATLEIVASEFIVDTRYVIRLAPNNTASVILELADIPLKLTDNSRELSANIKIKANATLQVISSLYIDGDDSGITPNTQSFTSGLYSAVHTNVVTVPDDSSLHTATLRFEISGYVTDIENQTYANIFLTLPHLIHNRAHRENPFVLRFREYLPDFYFDYDLGEANPTFPFFKFIDILTSAAGETWIERERMYGPEVQQLQTPEKLTEYWAQSTLVSPRSVREAYIPWIGQLTGSHIRQNIQLADGTFYLDNDQLRREFVEWQLSGSHFGRASGTREAMMESVKRVLLKTKDGEQSTLSVAITPKYLGDPFALRVQTLTNETYDADASESSELVLQMANLSKPMGYTVIHNTVDEFFFTFDDPTLGVLDSFVFG